VSDIALDALRAYDIEVADCAFVTERFNAIYRIDATDGSQYALRVGAELRIHADGCEELEAAWVNDLHAAGLPVARVVPARGGSPVTDVAGRRCVLFEWVAGRQLRELAAPELVHTAGALTARIHDHAAGYLVEPPAGAIVADRALYFRIDNRLEELRPAYGSVLDDALARTQETIDVLWRDPPHPPHLLHGDMQPGNVVVEDDRVTVVDFQDLVWGFEILDVVIALRDMPHGKTFRAGYETVRPWPDGDPETVDALVVARHLNVLNFALHVRKPGLDEFVARVAAPVAGWMRGPFRSG
jgi:Ser/Thr protein kinase RdoA (MazF antagonist)